jgi:hypothetical protein
MVCFGAALRRQVRTIVAVLAGLGVVLAAPAVHALNFPQDPQWVALTCNGDVLTDAVGEVQPAAVDAVGDPSNPAAYVFMDAASLFLRLRMNATVQQNGNANAYLPYAWACLIWTNAGASYLLWDGVNAIMSPGDVELLQNTQPQPGNPTRDPAETVLATYAIAVNAREAPAASNFGGDADVFIDWAVSLTDLAKAGITPRSPLRFLCGTSFTQRILDADVVGDEMSCGDGMSDGTQCSSGSCSACTTAAACGPTCATCGGATPLCNPAAGCTGSCGSSAQCSGATPVCDTARGLCVGCTSNAACPAGSYCETVSGTCAACPQGASSCTGPGNNVLANGSIEGGSCACDVRGTSARPGALAGLALGLVAAMHLRRRRASARCRSSGADQDG